MRLERRQFVKKMFAGLVCVGSGLKALFAEKIKCEGDIFGLPHINPEDCPPMPPVKPPRKFGTTSMSLTGDDDITDGKWHHFIYNKVGSVEEMYLDGKRITSMVFGVWKNNYDIMNFRREQVGNIIEEEFWYRDRENPSGDYNPNLITFINE